MPGYHQEHILKGVYGEFSKIEEEFDELKDAIDQNAKILEIVEFSDLIGAISAYLQTRYPGITVADLITMSELTKRAFQDGTRKN